MINCCIYVGVVTFVYVAVRVCVVGIDDDVVVVGVMNIVFRMYVSWVVIVVVVVVVVVCGCCVVDIVDDHDGIHIDAHDGIVCVVCVVGMSSVHCCIWRCCCCCCCYYY